MNRAWLVLHHQLPREPSAPRVSVWRKLKKLGAVLVQDTLWVLPDNDRTREQFRWLATEILEHGGQASVWTGASVLVGQDAQLEARFAEQIDGAYQKLLEALTREDTDLGAVSKQFQALRAQDHLRSEWGEKVRLALEQAIKEQT